MYGNMSSLETGSFSLKTCKPCFVWADASVNFCTGGVIIVGHLHNNDITGTAVVVGDFSGPAPSTFHRETMLN